MNKRNGGKDEENVGEKNQGIGFERDEGKQ